jgi:hypothetical protein
MPFLVLVMAIFVAGFLRQRASGATYAVVAIGAIAASLWQYLS